MIIAQELRPEGRDNSLWADPKGNRRTFRTLESVEEWERQMIKGLPEGHLEEVACENPEEVVFDPRAYPNAPKITDAHIYRMIFQTSSSRTPEFFWLVWSVPTPKEKSKSFWDRVRDFFLGSWQ